MFARLMIMSIALLGQSAQAATVMHCRMVDPKTYSGRHESWIINQTHFLQMTRFYEISDISALAHKKIIYRKDSVISATWDTGMESDPRLEDGGYRFSINTDTGAAFETTSSLREREVVYGSCWIIDQKLDGSEIPPSKDWKIPTP